MNGCEISSNKISHNGGSPNNISNDDDNEQNNQNFSNQTNLGQRKPFNVTMLDIPKDPSHTHITYPLGSPNSMKGFYEQKKRQQYHDHNFQIQPKANGEQQELDNIKKILLTNLTNQVQLLLEWKSRANSEQEKNLLKQRIDKVNYEMRHVNSIKNIQNIKESFEKDMIAPLDVTLRISSGNCEQELIMDNSSCSKFFSEYGKISQ